MLALLLTTQVLFASGRGPELHLASDEGLSCPANTLLENAVRIRLPNVRVARAANVAGEDLSARVSRVGGNAWRFEVRRGDGGIAMSRELMPMPCPQLADTCALILERFLSAIDWKGKQTPPIPKKAVKVVEAPVTEVQPERTREVSRPAEPESAPEPLPVTEPAASSASLGVAEGAVPRRRGDPLSFQLALDLGGGAWGSIPSEAAPHFSADLGLRIAGRFHASLRFDAAASNTRNVLYESRTRGTLTLQSFAALGTVSVCTMGEGFHACGGLLGGARLTTGTTTGTGLFRKTSTTAALPELGVHGRFTWPLYGRFTVALDLVAAVPLGTARFDVQGIDSAAYATPFIDLLGTLYFGVEIL